MTGNKKVLCKTCYKEMRSDNLTRHMKQHSKKNKNNPVINIPVTNNIYNAAPVAPTQRSEKENEIKEEGFRKKMIELEEEYQKKLVQGKKIYKS